jgi:hypothetical protein
MRAIVSGAIEKPERLVAREEARDAQDPDRDPR